MTEILQPRSRPTPLQRTIKNEIAANGIGVHSGKPATLRLKPAGEGEGLCFVRVDLEGQPAIPVSIDHIKSESLVRMTVLHDPEWKGEDAAGWGAAVGMIEHLLSACAGMGVTNLVAELDGPECPIFDGSGAEYVRLLSEAGIEEQSVPIRRFRIKEPVGLIKDNAELIAVPAEATRYTFFGEFTHAGLSDQQATFELYHDDYERMVAPARTFCFWKDIEGLLKAGLIKGGSTENAIVLKDGHPVQVDENNEPMVDENFKWRVDSELATHKLLDLIGDLSVLGGPVLGLISGRASGHAMHQEFARKLSEHVIEVE